MSLFQIIDGIWNSFLRSPTYIKIICLCYGVFLFVAIMFLLDRFISGQKKEYYGFTLFECLFAYFVTSTVFAVLLIVLDYIPF